MYDIVIPGCYFFIFGKQRDRARQHATIFQHLYRTPPCFMLAVVDLAQVKYMFLNNSRFANPMAFNNAPIPVLFTVFIPFVHS
jgi:hypothetical protein